MEKQLKYTLLLSLKHIALRKIAINLYNEPNILASIGRSKFKIDRHIRNIWDAPYSPDPKTEWRQSIMDKLSKLQLPESLMKQMLPILKAIGLEICIWKSIHETCLSESSDDFNVCVLEKLCWTTTGVVDYRKSAEILVRFDALNITKRFELACLYCLEDYVPVLWKELPEENKRRFSNSPVETPHLQLFLPYFIQKERAKLRDPQIFLFPHNYFEESALCFNKTLTEYCFGKLTEEQREASLVRTVKALIKNRNRPIPFVYEFKKGKITDILCHFLSLMSPEQQILVFKALPVKVLRCFLDWPWQDLFMDIPDVVWDVLTPSRYNDLAVSIRESVIISGYYFPNVIQNFFLRIPGGFRKRFVDLECLRGCIFPKIFESGDTETIKVVFRNVDAADRARLVFSKCCLDFIHKYSDDRWDVVKVFLEEATLSEQDRKGLKEAFLEYLRCEAEIEVLFREKYRKFFEIVEESEASAASKRSSDDETFAEVKKFCCEDNSVNDSLKEPKEN